MSLPSNFIVDQPQKIVDVNADDLSVAARLKYVGTAAAADDAQVVLASDDDFTFYDDFGNTELSSNFTSGVIATDGGADDMPWSEFAGLVNATDDWECTLVAALSNHNIYTHASTIQHIADVAGDSANALLAAQTSQVGQPLLYDTNVVTLEIATACIGLESELPSTKGTSFSARHMARTIPPGRRDITEKFIAHSRPMQGSDRVAFITEIETGNTTATVARVDIYSASPTTQELKFTYIGGAADTTGITKSFVTWPSGALMANLGERLVVIYGGENTSSTILTNPLLKVSGGYGHWRSF